MTVQLTTLRLVTKTDLHYASSLVSPAPQPRGARAKCKSRLVVHITLTIGWLFDHQDT